MLPASGNALPERVLKWVVESVDPRASVLTAGRLPGATSSGVHSISLRVGQQVRDFVLRLFDNAEWLQNEPDLAAHEAESLRFASRSGLNTPQIIACDESGSQCGIPAVLMTRLEGAVVLRPHDLKRWLDGLAQALVRIHAVEADDFPWSYYTYNDIPSLEIPSWSDYPEKWNEVIEIVRGPAPAIKPCFIHRDYHPCNVLWNGDKVSGIVDWVNACRGPAGIDIGHSRWNLAQLFDVPTADAFLSAYKRHAGLSFTYDPYWDLLSLIDTQFGPPVVYQGWTAFGVTGLTDELMRVRVDRYMASLLQRVKGT